MLFNIRQIGSAGVNTDIAPWDLPENALSNGRNFRVMAGKIQSSGGSRPEFLEKTSGEIGHIAYTEDYQGARMWIACTSAGIEKYGDDNKWSVVSAMTTSDPSLWSSCRIGQVLFLNHPEKWPVFFESATSSIQKLPWSPTQSSWESVCQAKILCSHKNFLFALNTGESPAIQRAITDTFADRVRWSHPVEPNGRPYTWQPAPADPSSLAGFVTMGRGGEIIGGESMRDSFVIYSDYAINVMDYTGDQLMWRRRTVSQSDGLVSKEAVIEKNGQHFFISKEDILQFDGNQVRSMLHNKLRREFASILEDKSLDTAFAVANDSYNEIYFCLPEKRDGIDSKLTPNVSFVYNYRDNNWSIREMSPSKQFTHSCYGKAPDKPNPWSGATTSWDTERQTWQAIGRTPFGSFLLASHDKQLYNIDTQSPEGEVTTKIERTDIPVGGHENVTTITRVYPQVEGTFPINVWVGGQDRAGGDVRWNGPVEFIPGKTRKIDIKVTGALHAIKMEAAAEGNFNITGLDVEYMPAGRR
jgi:hypothetical protein